MIISTASITGWRDLQNKVKDLFNELGYEAKVEQTIPLSNGAKVEVDVLATKGKSVLSQKILIECKFWNSDIPRAIVQSFKMDVQEAGANFGIIVSKKGFQSGAYEGITLTTVKLYTFEDLQHNLVDEWVEENLIPLAFLYNQLVDESRALQYGSIEREHFEKSLFNDELKLLRPNLEHNTSLILSLFKDYYFDVFQDNPLIIFKKSIKHNLPKPFFNGEQMSIEFYDARTFAQELKKGIERMLNEWFEYRKIFNEEFYKLTPEEMAKQFNIQI